MRYLCGFLVFPIAVICAADDLPTGVVNTQNPDDVSLTPAESLARIAVPDGFQVTLFAGEPDVRRPIAFDFDDRGRLWVIENYSHPKWQADTAQDRIVILEDSNHDGRFDRRTVFWDKGRYLTGLAVGHGGVWIANTPELSFISDRDHDDVPDADPVVMLDGFQISQNNVLNNFHWGPDGWLYGAIGLSSRSLVGKPGAADDQRVSITRGLWRYHPVNHVFEKVAEGMVNPWGADFNEFGDLITSNTVLAHLWHIVPGMYCERRASERDNPYAYDRIQTIANHLHWGGGGWASSRSPGSQKQRPPKQANKQQTSHDDHDSEYHRHSVAGGGHAHCGGMIYLGDNWPEKYRGTFFTNNLHGGRVNNDRLLPEKSSYVGVHSADMIFGNDPWFRGMSIKYGPDGGVYVSDWHDIGECHDSDGSHRSSGRIYKVVFGTAEKRTVDLQKMTGTELAELHLHPNAWLTRHARRILHERSVSGDELTDATSRLREMFADSKNEQHVLRALWTLYVVGELSEPRLVDLLRHDNQHVRRWAVRFLVDRQPCDTAPPQARQARQVAPTTLAVLTHLAQDEASPKVRLELACALQRLAAPDRLNLAAALLTHAEDATDPYIPLMIWYGIEPAVALDAVAAIQLAVQSRLPRVRQFIARRIVDVEKSPPSELIVAAALQQTSPSIRLDLLQGMLAAFDDRGTQALPSGWNQLYPQLTESSDATLRSVSVQLATIFGDQQAIARLRQIASTRTFAMADRQEALRSLLKLDAGVSVDMLHELATENSVLRRDVIPALIVRNQPTTAGLLLDLYPDLDATARRDAISVLVTRQSFVEQLLAAIDHGQVDRSEVSAFALQQLRSYKDAELQTHIAALWADDARRLKKSDEIARLKDVMSAEYLSRGSATMGRQVFDRTCSKCHTLFGEGGTLAPDLTGSGRAKTDYVLQNLIDPSAQIDEAYRLTTVVTTDGRLLNGFMVHQDDTWLIVRTQDAKVRLAMKDVDELTTNNISMMPDGMLRSLSDEQVRDLLVYLAAGEQVPAP